jgi:polyhydroxyalkanoate synthesis regulator phasin
MLHKAVDELVKLGAISSEEAERFETLLATSRGRILLHEPML